MLIINSSPSSPSAGRHTEPFFGDSVCYNLWSLVIRNHKFSIMAVIFIKLEHRVSKTFKHLVNPTSVWGNAAFTPPPPPPPPPPITINFVPYFLFPYELVTVRK
ncbi:unnamed protein product [Meganyctiphanes norvegica]|uniref:Uncharacterized protein n=1 Tax=Meganyctiphanes norvegica TaxID=48144 RepID=A0AAV2SUS7_MEGNR